MLLVLKVNLIRSDIQILEAKKELKLVSRPRVLSPEFESWCDQRGALQFQPWQQEQPSRDPAAGSTPSPRRGSGCRGGQGGAAAAGAAKARRRLLEQPTTPEGPTPRTSRQQAGAVRRAHESATIFAYA
ncbi:uncharacterized protein [Anabrus simplex]|uniref:uncharacterized protein n=1 Tax=Anabrus simplex TaxID=316456 RepID=UPI0035A3C17B